MTLIDVPRGKPRILVFIVAYNAEKTIAKVLTRIPTSLARYDTEVLIIDDASQDRTFEAGEAVRTAGSLPFKLTVLVNPVNQGYGGNQKLGFHYAIENGFDFVALIHGDGQYAPEALPELLEPLFRGEADAVFGSRMMRPFEALKGGMPLYKYIGNRILTAYQNFILGAHLTEFHSGYRLYSTRALRQIPFELNANVFHFDTEIIIQLLFGGFRIVEKPIPTYYGDEICYVNGMKYAGDVVRASTAARLQAFNLVHRRNFDVRPDSKRNAYYTAKFDFESPHSLALAEIKPGDIVLDVGCAAGYLAGRAKAAGARVVGIDKYPPADMTNLDEFILHDLDETPFPRTLEDVDLVLVLDVIEHLRSPETFMNALREAAVHGRNARIVVSTGNVGFIVPRLMLLLGQFNYGKRGILDLTHTRLFTFASLRRLFEETGFAVEQVKGVPAPVPLVVPNRLLAHFLLSINRWLIGISRTLFAYQIYMTVRPLPKLETLLEASHSHTRQRVDALLRSALHGD